MIVVDDEPIIRLDLCQMLADFNYDVIAEGADGFDAVELCRRKRPDIVLLDLEMPVFDGLTAAETIVEENLAGCIVICTAYADDAFLERAGRVGAAGYLVKPIEPRMLKPTLEMAYAQGRRLESSKRALCEANHRIEENRVIERAKGLLARARNISEMEAYRYMQKTAMEKRAPLLSIAQAVIRVETQRDAAQKAKQILMKTKNMTEQEAFRFLNREAAKQGLSTSAFAKKILEENR